jgi:hypothetical protein
LLVYISLHTANVPSVTPVGFISGRTRRPSGSRSPQPNCAQAVADIATSTSVIAAARAMKLPDRNCRATLSPSG